MGLIIGDSIPRVHSDVAGSPSETSNPGALTALLQSWNEFLHRHRKEAGVSEVAEMVAIERRVRRELYG